MNLDISKTPLMLVWGYPVSDLTSARHKAYKLYLADQFDVLGMTGNKAEYVRKRAQERHDREALASACQVVGRITRAPFDQLCILIMIGMRWGQAFKCLSPVIQQNYVPLDGTPGFLEPLFKAMGEYVHVCKCVI